VNIPSSIGGSFTNNWHLSKERVGIPALEPTFKEQSYSDRSIEIIGCTDMIGLIRKNFLRYCQPNGAFELNFDGIQDVFFAVDGEPYLLKELDSIKFCPMQPVKDLGDGEGHTVLVVRGQLPKLDIDI